MLLQRKLSDMTSRLELITKDYNAKLLENSSLEKEVQKLRTSLVQTMKNFGGDQNVVDRRIVIKLLVTYFEHNKPQEVLLVECFQKI